MTDQQVQVPKHVLRVFSDEGGQEKVEVQVTLPGVSRASDISVRIEPPDTVRVRVPDRYQLHLKLAVPIAAQADTVRFRSRTGKLTMHCLVVSPEQAAALQQAAQQAEAAPDDTNGSAQAAQAAPAAAQQPAAACTQQAVAAPPQHQAATQSGAVAISPALGCLQAAGRRAAAEPLLHSTNSTSAAQAQQPLTPTPPQPVLLAQQQTATSSSAGEQQQLHTTKQQQAVANRPTPLTPTATTTQHRSRSSSSRAGSTSSRGGGGVEQVVSSSTSMPAMSTATQGATTATGTATPTTSTTSTPSSSTSSSTPPPSLEFDWEPVLTPAFGRREKLVSHLTTIDGSTPMSREWMAEALRLQRQMVSSHAPNLVGWWCSLLDYLAYWLLFCCLHLGRWAGVCAGHAQGWPRCHALCQDLHTRVLEVYACDTMLQFAWVLAWVVPRAAWSFLVVGSWLSLTDQHRLAALQAEAQGSLKHLATTEALTPAVVKLLLASCTGAVLWLLLGLTWLLLGLGWQLLGLVWWLSRTTWWLLCWPWINLVWRPNLYYQVGAVGTVSTPFLVWACLLLCDVICPSRATTTRLAGMLLAFQMAALQVMLAGGHLRVVASFVVSLLWLDYKTHWRSSSAGVQQQPPWWQASLVGMAYPLARTWLGHLGAGWVLAVPNYIVAGAAWGVFELCWGLGGELSTGAAGLVGWLLGWLFYFPVWCCLFAFLAAVLYVWPGIEVGSSRVSVLFGCLAAAFLLLSLAVGTGSLDFLLPAGSWVWWLASRAVAWLFKPHLYVAPSLLRLSMLHLVPLPLLDRMCLRFCAQSELSSMQKACAFVGQVQLTAQAQASAHVPNPWWGNLSLFCWVAYVLAAHTLAWCLVCR